MPELNTESLPLDFIRTMIKEDVESGRYEGKVITRFPPEPNGYLHIGHAKAFTLNFSVADEWSGRCHLRFDDTNPLREETRYVESMKTDIQWLGFDWGEHEYFASDYYQTLYDFAVKLIEKGKAYIDHLSADEIREYRGTLTEPGTNSPHRDRSVDENLDLFRRMREGEFAEGSCVLRAKIDMASGNINLRDPVMYRILKTHHHRTGDAWCIYPTYDWAHGQSDSIEGVTHSLCDISFEDHRPLYDWFLDQLDIFHPRQIEFARLNLTYTVLQKRDLRKLVEGGQVSGWDDPRLPTLQGLRRRGYTPTAIRAFINRVGMSKTPSVVDVALLEFTIREELNREANRRMAVLKPLKMVIVNYPEGETEELEAENNPEKPEAGKRMLPFSREIYIERDDFREVPPPKYHRLSPGKEIRLKHAYYVTCTDVIKDGSGEVVEVHCTYDPETRGGWSDDGRKVKGTSHWVSAEKAVDAEVRLIDRLFTRENMEDLEEDRELVDYFNPDSRIDLSGCKVEPELAKAGPGMVYQFLRQGYFCVDSVDSQPGAPVFNRVVSLRDSWAKIEKKNRTGN